MSARVPELVAVTDQGSGRSLRAWVCEVGADVVVAVAGGDRPHVGCAVLTIPSPKAVAENASPSSSVLTIPPHKDEPIARAVAEAIGGELGRVALVTAGVHEDHLDHAGIETYLRLGRELAAAVVARLARPG